MYLTKCSSTLYLILELLGLMWGSKVGYNFGRQSRPRSENYSDSLVGKHNGYFKIIFKKS